MAYRREVLLGTLGAATAAGFGAAGLGIGAAAA